MVEQQENQQIESQEPEGPSVANVILKDVFVFPWILWRKVFDPQKYEAMGMRGSAKRVVGLTILDACLFWCTIAIVISSNPFIAARYDFEYAPFFFVFTSLIVANFLAQMLASFLSFRALGGRGSPAAHGYCMALSYSNVIVFFWVLFILAAILRLHGNTLNFLFGLSNLYLLLPLFFSLEAIHHTSRWKSVVGMLGSIVAGVVFGFLFYLSWGILHESRPYRLSNLPLLAIVDGTVLIASCPSLHLCRLANKLQQALDLCRFGERRKACSRIVAENGS